MHLPGARDAPRRLEACRRLGYDRVEVRDVTGCDDAALRAIELEENEARLDLETLDKSKARLAERHPFLARDDNGWLKTNVLRAGKLAAVDSRQESQ